MANLPKPFAQLQTFLPRWDFPNSNARYAARLSYPLPELRTFYDAVKPQGAAIVDYLSQKSLDEFTPEDQALGRLMFAYAVVAVGLELYGGAAVPDTGSAIVTTVQETELV